MKNIEYVDLEYFKKTTGFDDQETKGFIEIFLEYSPEEIRLLETYCKEKDCEKIRGIAHKLKPRITYMGIHKLFEPMDKLHTCAKEGANLDQIDLLYKEVKQVFDKVMIELEDKKAKL